MSGTEPCFRTIATEFLRSAADAIREYQVECQKSESSFSHIQNQSFESFSLNPEKTNQMTTILHETTGKAQANAKLTQEEIDNALIGLSRHTKKPLKQSFIRLTRMALPDVSRHDIVLSIKRLIQDGRIKEG